MGAVGPGDLGCRGRFALEADTFLSKAELADEGAHQACVVGAERLAGEDEDGSPVELGREGGLFGTERYRLAGERKGTPSSCVRGEDRHRLEVEGAAKLGHELGERRPARERPGPGQASERLDLGAGTGHLKPAASREVNEDAHHARDDEEGDQGDDVTRAARSRTRGSGAAKK